MAAGDQPARAGARQRRSLIRRQRLLDRLSAVPRVRPGRGGAAVDAAIDAARLAPALTTALSGLSGQRPRVAAACRPRRARPRAGRSGARHDPQRRPRSRLCPVSASDCRVSSPTCPCRTRARRCPMLTIDRQPPLPELRQFSQEMEARSWWRQPMPAPSAPWAGSAATWRPSLRRLWWSSRWSSVSLAAKVPDRTRTPPSPCPQLASFEVSTAPGGLVKLTLSPGQLRDPGALRQALAKVSVPALVTVGKICYVPGPSAILTQVLSSPTPAPAGRQDRLDHRTLSDPQGDRTEHRLLPRRGRIRDPRHLGARPRRPDVHGEPTHPATPLSRAAEPWAAVLLPTAELLTGLTT